MVSVFRLLTAEFPEQLLVPRPRVRPFSHIHKQGEILNEGAPLGQLLQIDLQRAPEQIPLVRMIRQLVDRITMQIDVSVCHSISPFPDFSLSYANFRRPSILRKILRI